MKRTSSRFRGVLMGAVLATAGCAGPYEEPGSTAYVLGTIMIIIGVALGIALILSLNE